jgi:hypothetical protein
MSVRRSESAATAGVSRAGWTILMSKNWWRERPVIWLARKAPSGPFVPYADPSMNETQRAWDVSFC